MSSKLSHRIYSNVEQLSILCWKKKKKSSTKYISSKNHRFLIFSYWNDGILFDDAMQQGAVWKGWKSHSALDAWPKYVFLRISFEQISRSETSRRRRRREEKLSNFYRETTKHASTTSSSSSEWKTSSVREKSSFLLKKCNYVVFFLFSQCRVCLGKLITR